MRATLWLMTAMLGLLLLGCAAKDTRPTAEVRQVLAPTGKLRVGLYLGSPLSITRDPASGETNGVGFELGKEFARWLGVPFEPVVYPGNGEVLEALKSGIVDVAFTNATAARAKDLDFTQPYLEMEAGFLVPHGSSITTFADVDRPGVRVVVTEGSTSAATLPRLLKNASVVRAPTINSGVELLSLGKVDVFATNKTILFEMSDKLPGSRVLDGRYGVEQIALGIPKGRELGMAYARRFVAAATSGGLVKSAAQRARLRGGTVKADSL